MTEIKEFLEKYGSVEVKFYSYYKYFFVFVGSAPDGTPVTVSVGGDAGSIYRFDVDCSPTTVAALYNETEIRSAHVGLENFFWD